MPVTTAPTMACSRVPLQHGISEDVEGRATTPALASARCDSDNKTRALQSVHRRGLGGSCLWERMEGAKGALDLRFCG
jgi:hypothetical protein